MNETIKPNQRSKGVRDLRDWKYSSKIGTTTRMCRFTRKKLLNETKCHRVFSFKTRRT